MRCAETTACRLKMNALSAPTLSQRAAYDTAFDQTASHIFVMNAMLARQRLQLNMPRPDGYHALKDCNLKRVQGEPSTS